jgi:siroheme synthase-like protein
MQGEMHRSDAVFYPLFFDLRGRKCLVVGAGEIATRKAESLLSSGADVKVVSPEACEDMKKLLADSRLEWLQRPFEASDLDGCLLVIASTNDPDVNRHVFDEAEKRGMPANIVDVPELCNFIVPSVMRRGDFQVAVSTGGASPVLARESRKWLEKAFGPQWGPLVKTLAEIRSTLKERLPKEEYRRCFWDMMIDLDFFNSLSEEHAEREIRERAEKCLSQLED